MSVEQSADCRNIKVNVACYDNDNQTYRFTDCFVGSRYFNYVAKTKLDMLYNDTKRQNSTADEIFYSKIKKMKLAWAAGLCTYSVVLVVFCV